MKVLQDSLVSSSRKDILSTSVTCEMIKALIHCYAWQLVYSNDLIYTYEIFHIPSIDDKFHLAHYFVKQAIQSKRQLVSTYE